MKTLDVDHILPEEIGTMIDEGINIFYGRDFLKIGQRYRLKESFLSVLIMVLRSHGVKLHPQEKVPFECQFQIWKIILNNLTDNVDFPFESEEDYE